MSKIHRWWNWDMLDGNYLHNRERIRVTFPDGVTEDHEVVVEDFVISEKDPVGEHYPLRAQHAFIELEYHGHKYHMPLLGLEAVRIKE